MNGIASKRSSRILYILAAIVVLAIIGFVSYEVLFPTEIETPNLQSSNNVDISHTGTRVIWTTCINEVDGFEVDCPMKIEGHPKAIMNGEWFGGKSLFGTYESKPGGSIWGIGRIRSEEVEKDIAYMYDQLGSSRIENREAVSVDGRKGFLVVVTDANGEWEPFKAVYLPDGTSHYFVIYGNDTPEFERFYQSFKFIGVTGSSAYTD